MAAYQIFTGLARWVLPRVGVFSIDREGADLSAFKTAVNTLAEGKLPLVIFPEGEIYRVAERITPLREGAFAIAAAAARKLADSGRKLWIVPVGFGYRFLEGHDPLPGLAIAHGQARNAIHLASSGPASRFPSGFSTTPTAFSASRRLSIWARRRMERTRSGPPT